MQQINHEVKWISLSGRGNVMDETCIKRHAHNENIKSNSQKMLPTTATVEEQQYQQQQQQLWQHSSTSKTNKKARGKASKQTNKQRKRERGRERESKTELKTVKWKECFGATQRDHCPAHLPSLPSPPLCTAPSSSSHAAQQFIAAS